MQCKHKPVVFHLGSTADLWLQNSLIQRAGDIFFNVDFVPEHLTRAARSMWCCHDSLGEFWQHRHSPPPPPGIIHSDGVADLFSQALLSLAPEPCFPLKPTGKPKHRLTARVLDPGPFLNSISLSCCHLLCTLMTETLLLSMYFPHGGYFA